MSEIVTTLNLAAYILSCADRSRALERTLFHMRATDWGTAPHVELDTSSCPRPQDRQTATSLKLLNRAIADGADFILFLEDDLTFNRYLRHNLEHWQPLRSAAADRDFFASLYNPNVRHDPRPHGSTWFFADPESVYGSQAFVLSSKTAKYVVEHWQEIPAMQDIKMSRLAARSGPIAYHAPSLVQHLGQASTWGGPFHWARDFDPEWRAPVNEPQDMAAVYARIDEIARSVAAIQGWLADEAGARLYRLARFSAPVPTIVELGSWRGRSTAWLASAIKDRGEGHVYAVDLWDGTDNGSAAWDGSISPDFYTVLLPGATDNQLFDEFLANLRERNLLEHVTPIRSDTVKSSRAWLLEREIGLLFIDASHDYRSVRQDFEFWSPMVTVGGFVVFDDVPAWPGPTRLVEELPHWYRRVYASANQLCVQKASPTNQFPG